jgi:4-hydroxy-4-methyl-2-oxoglutarate aldolase
VAPPDDAVTAAWAALRRIAGEEEGLSSLLSDALGRVGGVDARVAAVWPGARCAGPALTVRTAEGDLSAVFDAIDGARPGDVIVIERPSLVSVAMWGEHTSLSARNQGAAGVVVDAPCRDRAAHARIGFPVFAAGVMPQGARPVGGGEVGVAITIGGVTVAPGDAVVADEDGVVVVPQGRLVEAMAALPATLDRDRATRAALARGGTVGALRRSAAR